MGISYDITSSIDTRKWCDTNPQNEPFTKPCAMEMGSKCPFVWLRSCPRTRLARRPRLARWTPWRQRLNFKAVPTASLKFPVFSVVTFVNKHGRIYSIASEKNIWKKVFFLQLFKILKLPPQPLISVSWFSMGFHSKAGWLGDQRAGHDPHRRGWLGADAEAVQGGPEAERGGSGGHQRHQDCCWVISPWLKHNPWFNIIISWISWFFTMKFLVKSWNPMKKNASKHGVLMRAGKSMKMRELPTVFPALKC